MKKDIRITKLLDSAVEIAKEAGKSIFLGEKSIIYKKSDHFTDVVTKVDLVNENLIKFFLETKFPSIGFMGEETGIAQGKSSLMWIVDPLDGTASFVDGETEVTVSIGLFDSKQNEFLLSVVYHPYSDEVYTAIKSKGAFLNGHRISTNRIKKRIPRIVMDATLNNSTSDSVLLARKNNKIIYYSGIGSMALRICYVARGNRDATLSLSENSKFKIYDYGPAGMILEEAGGRLYDMNHHVVRPTSSIYGFYASNNLGHSILMKIL